MFASVSTLIPQDAHSPLHAAADSYATYTSSQQPNTQLHALRNAAQRGQPNPPARTMLSVLRADEKAMELRKAHVRRFGAGWLKPPGISKTLQGMWDEKAEREEQEAAQAREQALADEQAAAAAQAEVEAQNALGLAGEDDDAADERDLDDEIPEADDTNWVDDEEDAEDALPTDEGDGDYAEDLATAATAANGTAAPDRDLDDDVPEAGSYQHTDTDLEDSSDEQLDDDMQEATGQGVMPGNASAAALGSSFFGSSPVGQSAGVRRIGGHAGRARGREN